MISQERIMARKQRRQSVADSSRITEVSAVLEQFPVVETVAEVEGETVINAMPVIPCAKPKRYTPPPCNACTAIRPPDTNYTIVNGTETVENTPTEFIITRACKCKWCGNTWPDKKITRHKV